MRSKPLARPAEGPPPDLSFRDRIAMSDWPPIRGMLRKTGVFTDREVEVVRELMDDTVNRPDWGNYRFWLAEIGRSIAGLICVSPIHVTPDRYEIYWLAVDPDCQGRGCAARLTALAVECLKGLGGKKLYVETSTRPIYEPARKFYLRAGFSLEATLPDYYSDGDGKAIFAIRL
jgi:ribosomal protein S18 acetylase RimI-like enzyme